MVESASFPYKTVMSETNVNTNRMGSTKSTITKNGVLSVTTLFLRIFRFSLRTPYKELILCANKLNANINIFRRRWNFIGGCFFPCEFFPRLANRQTPRGPGFFILDNKSRVTCGGPLLKHKVSKCFYQDCSVNV